jgi:hypothetical protein
LLDLPYFIEGRDHDQQPQQPGWSFGCARRCSQLGVL